MASQASPPKASSGDLIRRGQYKSTPAGTLTFVGLRLLDPILQYKLLTAWGNTLFSALGLATINSTLPVLTTGIANLDKLGLSPPQLIILSMAAGSAAKQIFWLVALSKEEFPVKIAIPVAGYNTFMNSLSSLVFTCAATSAALSSWDVGIPATAQRLALPIAVGSVLYAVGIALETAAEIQRKRFKDEPINKGKICRRGLWAWARHINYGGYTLWRMGYLMAAGGWIGGTLMGAFHLSYFSKAVGVLDEYMGGKYKDQWVRYKQDVRWTVLPGVW